MMKKINYGKIFIVCLLTVLIWLWADLAKTEELRISNAVIGSSKSVSREILVSFGAEPKAIIEEVILRGPTSKVSDVRQRLNEGTLKPEFFYEPDSRAIADGKEVINLRDYLRESQQIKQLGLVVESCEPATVEVRIQKLVKKQLNIICKDYNGNIIPDMVVEPVGVEMFVPASWEGQSRVAEIRLSDNDIVRAREICIDKTPFVELQPGHIRDSYTLVKVKALAKESFLEDLTITRVTLGVTMSKNLLSKYDVEVENLSAVTTPFTVEASQNAKIEYEAMKYQVILEIYDEDADESSELNSRRPLVYNFPSEYVRKDEIRLKQQPVIAQFRLVPKTPKPQD